MFPAMRPAMTLRAALFSLFSLSAAVLAAALAPDAAADYEVLLWLLAVIPAFLLAHYRGWGGVASALAIAMVALTLVQIASTLFGPDARSWSVTVRVVLVFVGTMVAVGVLAGMLHRARDEIERLDPNDRTTDLPNRRSAHAVLEREIAAALRGRPLTIVLFEIDNFRELRERHGEEGVTQALRKFARLLARHTRRMNYSARLEGGRFISILSSGTPDGARIFVQRLQASVVQEAGGPAFTVSAGIAAHEPGMRTADELLRAADLALYQAQQAGAGSINVREVAERTAAVQASLRQLRGVMAKSGRLGLEGT